MSITTAMLRQSSKPTWILERATVVGIGESLVNTLQGTGMTPAFDALVILLEPFPLSVKIRCTQGKD